MNLNRISLAQPNYSNRKVEYQNVNFQKSRSLKRIAGPMAAALLFLSPFAACDRYEDHYMSPEERRMADSLKHITDSLKNKTYHDIDSIQKTIDATKDSVRNKVNNAKNN